MLRFMDFITEDYSMDYFIIAFRNFWYALCKDNNNNTNPLTICHIGEPGSFFNGIFFAFSLL